MRGLCAEESGFATEKKATRCEGTDCMDLTGKGSAQRSKAENRGAQARKRGSVSYFMSAYAEKGKQMNLRGDRSDVSGIDWPYNLLQQIGMDDDDPLEHMSDEAELLLVMSLRNMTEREKKVIILRYFEQKTLKEVGEIIGVQQERVRQIEAKAIRKMRWNDCHYILTHGIKAYIDKRVDEKVNAILKIRADELEAEYREKLASAYIQDDDDRRTAKAKLLATTIEEMDLSVRAYNCMKRTGCKTIGDILRTYPTYEKAVTIRNLGRKSLEEVSEKMQTFGFMWPIYEE